MPPRDSRHFVPALVTLGENPRFLFGRPRPPSARSGEDLKPTTRLPLRFVQKLSVRHVSNSLSTQRRQTIDPAPHRGRCGLTTAYAYWTVWRILFRICSRKHIDGAPRWKRSLDFLPTIRLPVASIENWLRCAGGSRRIALARELKLPA